MASIGRRQSWVLAVLVSLSGLFGLLGWQSHGGYGVSSAHAWHTLAGDVAPPGPK